MYNKICVENIGTSCEIWPRQTILKTNHQVTGFNISLQKIKSKNKHKNTINFTKITFFPHKIGTDTRKRKSAPTSEGVTMNSWNMCKNNWE